MIWLKRSARFVTAASGAMGTRPGIRRRAEARQSSCESIEQQQYLMLASMAEDATPSLAAIVDGAVQQVFLTPSIARTVSAVQAI